MAHHRVALVWLRRTLRLADNPALVAAIESADAVVVVHVLAEDAGRVHDPGEASRAWLAHSLVALDGSLRDRGAGLVVRVGPEAETLSTLASGCRATAVHFDTRSEPTAAAADARTCQALEAAGIAASGFNCSLLSDPDLPRTTSGGPYRVFTPYYQACLRAERPETPLDAPARVPSPGALPAGVAPAAVLASPAPPELAAHWQPGEAGAQSHAERFFAEAVEAYPADRDRPDLWGTSRLSPHLAFGEIGPRQLLALARDAANGYGAGRAADGATAFVRQLYWREFCHHLLHHFPHTTTAPLRPEFQAFPWIDDANALEAWQAGRTGYPIVDAGMRELAACGWMHNRVRMIVASFLTKDLLVPWQEGARWFGERLTDADLANNTFGWQWVAGSGADASPYFRVFNPALQGAKFDPDGAYVRRWVPELAAVPARWIHRPWEATDAVLGEAGVTLGRTYPAPIVDHAEARARALAIYDALKRGQL